MDRTLKRSKNKLFEHNLQADYYQGWKIVHKYAQYLQRATLSRVNNKSKYPDILESLETFNTLMIYEFKSCGIDYKNKRFYRVWNDTDHTIKKNIKRYRSRSEYIMLTSIMNITNITTHHLELNK